MQNGRPLPFSVQRQKRHDIAIDKQYETKEWRGEKNNLKTWCVLDLMWFIFVLQSVVSLSLYLISFLVSISVSLFFPPIVSQTFYLYVFLFRLAFVVSAGDLRCRDHSSSSSFLFVATGQFHFSPSFFFPLPYSILFFPQKYLTPHWSSTIHFHSVHGCVTPCELWGGRKSYIWLRQSKNVRKCAKEKICLSLLSGFTWSFSRLLRQYLGVAFCASSFVPQSLFWSCLLVCA